MADPKNRAGINDKTQSPPSEDELNTVLGLLGFLIPVGEAEVKQAEVEMVGSNAELPAALRDGRFLDRAEQCEDTGEIIHVDFNANEPVAQDLARAAREGGTISDEVEARMRMDRKRSENLSNGRT